MKSLTDLIHKTPWWALLFGGVAVLLALAAFVTPYHLIQYRKQGATPEQQQAIKHEIDNAFAENAIDIARGVLQSMIASTGDKARRTELEQALKELDGAREELRHAGSGVLRAKREALETTREALRSATDAIREAHRDAEQALKDAGVTDERVTEKLQQSLKAAEEAEAEAKKSLREERRKRIVIGKGKDSKTPLIEIDGSGTDSGPQVKINPPGEAAIVIPPVAPLPPEIRDQIRTKVTGDMYRIGIGAGLILIFIPLFALTMIAKFFIDRSRAAQRLADLTQKEADFHRMGEQVTQAKLQALQAQVEPHFLYNTLASVQALTEVDPKAANEMTGHLIQYLRNALPKMRDSVSTVGQEVELVRAFLNILQMRMGRRLAFEIEVPEALAGLPFPPLMLPSLVENAIEHGLEPQREGGSVKVGAQVVEGKLRVSVTDTGRGFGESVGAGLGLANIRERLAALYGDAGRLVLEENAPQGAIATIEVPAVANAPAGESIGVPPTSSSGASASASAPAPAEPKGAAAKTLAALGTAERAWRKTLSFAFIVLVVVAAIASGLAIFGVATGVLPVHVGGDALVGPGGAIVGTVGIALAFGAIVLALAIVVAVIYGLGFLLVGIAIFVPLVMLIALAPVLAPILLVGLFIWWLVRRKKTPEPAPKIEPK